jgi:hypothetical protein
MPSNGPAENILYGLKGIPLFTYGMIGITTLVLAYVTFTDVDIENPLDTINPVSELQIPEKVTEESESETEKVTEETEAGQEPKNITERSESENATEESENATEEPENATEESENATKEPQPVKAEAQLTKATPMVEATLIPEEPSAPPLEKIDEQQKGKGGKKRTIRNKQKKRRTIRR